MIYNIDFDIAAIAITLFTIFYIFNKKGLHKTSNRIYLLIVLTGFISALSDIFSSIANSSPDPDSFLVQDIWNYSYLVIHNIMPYFLVLYILHLLGRIDYLSKKMHLLFLLPYAADLFVLILNPFLKWVFFYDYDGSYVHGTAFTVLYVVGVLYMLIALYLILCHSKILVPEKRNPLLFFILLTAVSVSIQMIFPYLMLELFFQSIGLLSILYSMENKEDIISPETGVFNRHAFTTAAELALAGERSELLLIKLSNIQYCNTTAGLAYMNAIQKDIAKWLEQLNKNASCYDIGNGHFVLLWKKNATISFEDLENRILYRFSKTWGRSTFRLTFPVQLCRMEIPKTIHTMENLMLVADLPFEGVNNAMLDAQEAIKKYQRRIQIEKLINEALKKKSFKVYFQPIWEKKSEKIHSAEALIRLIDDELGYISPEEFIPVAEENGSIIEIGTFVFEEVCKFYQERRLADLGIAYVEVNLSVVQCMNKSLVSAFEEILSRYHLSADRINLEITESAASENREMMNETVRRLTDRGFQFSLDDYGTGYSNFSYLYDLPFSIIKLDKSILWSAWHPKSGKGEPNAMVLLENTIRMMHQMDYSILVEGVETADQKILLEKVGCDLYQGYYFAKPLPAEAFLDFVKVVNA